MIALSLDLDDITRIDQESTDQACERIDELGLDGTLQADESPRSVTSPIGWAASDWGGGWRPEVQEGNHQVVP